MDGIFLSDGEKRRGRFVSEIVSNWISEQTEQRKLFKSTILSLLISTNNKIGRS